MNVVERRREIREIVAYLRSDLFERDRDYASRTFDVKPVKVDHEREMLWGSPLGWRVLIAVADDQSIRLTIYDADGREYARSSSYYGTGAIYWLEEWLP